MGVASAGVCDAIPSCAALRLVPACCPACRRGHSARQHTYDPAPRRKQDLEQLVSAVEELPFLSSSSQVEQTSWLLWCFADWARQPENSRARMTPAQCNAVLDLLQRMAVEARGVKAGNPPAPPPMQQFNARQLNMAAWSLGQLQPHLPAATVTAACTALACHSASSEAMKRGSWRDWSTLLHGLATAGMQCSSSPDLTRLCDQAVQLLPGKLARGAAGQDISMTLLAMVKSDYTGSAQPLLQSVTAAISQGDIMRDAKPQAWANLIWAASKLPGCRQEARQLLSLFSARAQAVVPGLNAQDVSNILYAMGLVLWHDKEVCRQLAERAAQAQTWHAATQLLSTLRQYDPPPRPKQDLEQLVSAVEELPFLSSSSQVEQTSQLLWCFADWARQPENSRARMTQAQCNAVLDLLQHMAGGARDETAGKPPPLPPLQQFDARQLDMAAWSLGKLKSHLPAAAVTSACTALARHSASSEAMKRGSWRSAAAAWEAGQGARTWPTAFMAWPALATWIAQCAAWQQGWPRQT
ncbi:hypothetical protein HaLaN_11243 [Haematococcus lacustris]|uniref:RAP domain-containing protein n=1 Tax=Haematococcus lacustris TaxID=44745 RepID=A0A699YZE8_HAELA|nr:hypothetical protein HaLaN_11243 [Haematococcus lacustris]